MTSIDTSAEAVERLAERLSTEGRVYTHTSTAATLRALAAERDALLETHTDKADAWDVMTKKNETIAQLRKDVAEARNAALDACLSVVSAQLLIDWVDKKSPAVDGANRMRDAIFRNVLALKTPIGDDK